MAEKPVLIAVEEVEFFIHNLYTRFPFRYGIATLTAVPHLMARVRVSVNGPPSVGISAEHLPPKWFTKDPKTSFQQDLPDLFAVVQHAAEIAKERGRAGARSYFQVWKDMYEAQSAWAKSKNFAPLLANLGVALMERAMLDAICRALGQPFSAILRDDTLAISLGDARPELHGMKVTDFLPDKPLSRIIARHTVGLSDPLSEADIPADERVNDGLPQSLEASIKAYGLHYFKVKLSGKFEVDSARLRQLSKVMAVAGDYRFTLDANENFRDLDHFMEDWRRYQEDAAIRELMKRLTFVEQPLHRDSALKGSVGPALAQWTDKPTLIIDESDADLDSLPTALHLGYRGTSHKNCKGIVKGLANAALLAKHRRETPEQPWILSGEDLSNIGPIALLQDVCVMANFGIENVERNGQHYFRGLSGFPKPVQEAIAEAHPDLYHRHVDGFPAIAISEGHISAKSVTESGFGVKPLIDLGQFTPLAQWDFASLERK